MTYRIGIENLATELQVKNGEMNLKFEAEQTISLDEANLTMMDVKVNSDVEIKAVDPSYQAYLVSGSQDIDEKVVDESSNEEVGSAPNSKSKTIGKRNENLIYRNVSHNVDSKLRSSRILTESSVEEKYLVDENAVTGKAYSKERP